MPITFTHEDLDWLEEVASRGIRDNDDVDITLDVIESLETTLNAVMRALREAKARHEEWHVDG